MKRPILILKLGTASITRADGRPDEPVMVDIARQVAQLHQHYRIVLVSSGAVGMGRRFLPEYAGTIAERKAAAAIGNPILMQKYASFFAPYDIALAQSLCERQHFSNRTQFLQLRETFESLWANGLIPIANENDVVSNLELKFSDNDELATLIAVGFGADLLLLGTSVPGVLDGEGEVVLELPDINEAALGLATRSKSSAGLGGMISKLTFARLATRMGIPVVIFGTRTQDGILEAVAGRTGTRCLPQTSSLSARNKWLASGSLVSGRVQVDHGAYEALLKRKSLLAVGVQAVVGPFDKGEIIELAIGQEAPFAVARAKLSAAHLQAAEDKRDLEVAHADDIVLL
ncbi:MAG: glutamate 5-kinase [Verrucomicrobiota bacterium]